MNTNIGSNLTIEKIPDFIHVNLKVRYFNMEFQVFLHAIDVIEDVIDDSRDNTLLVRIADDSLHRVRFTCVRKIRIFYYLCSVIIAFEAVKDPLPDDV